MDIAFFKTPSGNIHCGLIVDGGYHEARCDIMSSSFAPPPPPADCDLDWGEALVVSDGPGTFICHGDTIIDPESPVLPYGATTMVGPMECSSERSGVTCQNVNTGHGFSVRKAAYTLF